VKADSLAERRLRGWIVVLGLSVVLFAAACIPRDDAHAQGPGIACLSVALDQCLAIAEAASKALPAQSTVTYTEVGPRFCDSTLCSDPLVPGDELTAIAQLADGPPRLVTVAAADTGFVATDVAEAGLIELKPSSRRAGGFGPFPFALQHCGLGSPIDFDGSFWDPVGTIDMEAPEASNAIDGTLVLTSSEGAHFSTATGFELDLVRHVGSKSYPGCA